MNALEQLTKISLVKKILLLVVIVMLFSAGYYFLYYEEQNSKLSALEGEFVSLERQKQDATRRASTYDKDRHRRDELKKSYAQQLRALPADAEMSSFLNSLNTQAELVGLELQSVKPEKEEPSQYYARIPVKLRLTGSFLQLAKFFYLVGNVDRIINIENISLKVKEIETTGVSLEVDVLATTFRSVKTKSDKKGKKQG
ncbi:MAG: type 4a pilus biogenesis protein PilO [Deltaproteobacteria bacterium]|nr:type 4a pilus biogenesis protein PilO [Deltaproteobacteria bacterium]